jgi:predicted nuclease with TOPRIM domain
MDQELIAYLDARFGETSREFREAKERAGQLQIMVESMRDDIRQVAEGVIANNEKIDAFKSEIAAQFDEMRGLLRPVYIRLDTRISSLEAWRERTERDPIEMVRELLGKPKS